MDSQASEASELTGLLVSLPNRLPTDDPGAQLTDAAYHEIQLAARGALEGMLAAISSHLLERHLPHLVVLRGQDPVTLTGPFPHKLAATRAGLGWIGKSGLLVTSDYGPRLYLATVLLDLDLQSAEPVEIDGCADCRACVDVCPGGCITGRPWSPGAERGLLVDAFACQATRIRMGGPSGPAAACGLCQLACPFGRDMSGGRLFLRRPPAPH